MSRFSLLISALGGTKAGGLKDQQIGCPICNKPSHYLDAVDFNKSCEELNGFKLPDSGTSIDYYLCDECAFCFAPSICEWEFEKFERDIYNKDYEAVDPDYKVARPRNNANFLAGFFGSPNISHLDYGGGSGVLSDTLKEKGWNSLSYDPFVNRDKSIDELGRFDLVTAFEVFEHVPDVRALFADLNKVLMPNSILLFTTLLSDGHIERGKPLDWWYASPRNGHISIFSSHSLTACMKQYGFEHGSLQAGLYVAFREIPDWARPVFA